jgi:hypothetical protein
MKKILVIIVLLVTSYQLLVTGAAAQTPAQVILTWQANNFYPADFGGKAQAAKNTPITVAVEVLRNGRLVNLSEATFTWYVDEKLQGRGNGLKEISFTVNKLVGDSHFVRVSVQSGENIFESSIRVPVSKPAVVLEAPYPNQLVGNGDRPEITAVPYFFNINSFQNLNFFWQVNNGEVRDSGNDNQLALNIGTVQAGEQIQVAGTARNRNNISETATARIRLITY